MKRSALCVSVVCTFATIIWATTVGNPQQAPTGKTKDVITLLNISGLRKALIQTNYECLAYARKEFPSVPEATWKQLEKEIDVNYHILQHQVPIISKYLSHDDVRELIRFSQTPTGRRFLAVYPQMRSELFNSGFANGRQAALQMIQRIQLNGIAAQRVGGQPETIPGGGLGQANQAP